MLKAIFDQQVGVLTQKAETIKEESFLDNYTCYIAHWIILRINTVDKSLGRELSGDLFLWTKEESSTSRIPNRCFKCENIAKVETQRRCACEKNPWYNQAFTLSCHFDIRKDKSKKKGSIPSW